ncbi:UDP-N-acetylmuramyl peptide synthase [Bifidobacterium thermophilum]|uniref:UDP-N-acetylmuramyl peptide synthase n=1 Tax=Bifidobacterium thermophilum TaxID=33905 RepID=UPI003099F281
MSVVTEAVGLRMTLGDICARYDFELIPGFAGGVTVTSISNDIDSIKPGSLFTPLQDVDAETLHVAHAHGAYAALIPHTSKDLAEQAGYPVIVAEPTPAQIGSLAATMAGDPSKPLAVFAVGGHDDDEVRACTIRLAAFLHMLGNPVGQINAAGSSSLERQLSLSYPLNIYDIQHIMSVCAEDGAAAIIIALEPGTLADHALEGAEVDVVGSHDTLTADTGHAMLDEWMERYGFSLKDGDRTIRQRDAETDGIAAEAVDGGPGTAEASRLSLAISMVMAAGVRKSNIRSALRVSHEMR